MTVSVEYLAEHIDDVLAALSAGESLEVAREGQSTLRLSASAMPVKQAQSPRVLGTGEGEMAPLSWEEWKRIDREWKKSFLEEDDVD